MPSQNNLTSALLKESGYTMYHYCRPNKQGGGGVAIIAKSTFTPKNGKTMTYTTFEVFIQSLKVCNNSRPVTLTLVIIYRLGKESKSDFINEFYSFMEFLIP